jgi:hypothetical protein
MTMSDLFHLEPEVLTLLRHGNVTDQRGMEYGAAGLDPKRPYGNSDLEEDIARILGWAVGCDGLSNDERDQVYELHAKTPTALQIVLSVGYFEPGIYKRHGTGWELVLASHGYAVFTETNEHEGETWRTYIQYRGNEGALRLLAEVVAESNKHTEGYDEDDDEGGAYELDLDHIMPSWIAEALAQWAGDGGCTYTRAHDLRKGVLTIPDDALERAREGHDPLYKTEVREWIK